MLNPALKSMVYLGADVIFVFPALQGQKHKRLAPAKITAVFEDKPGPGGQVHDSGTVNLVVLAPDAAESPASFHAAVPFAEPTSLGLGQYDFVPHTWHFRISSVVA